MEPTIQIGIVHNSIHFDIIFARLVHDIHLISNVHVYQGTNTKFKRIISQKSFSR